MLISYWFWFSILYLGILTYQDLKTLRIDDRLNFFMLGATAPLFAIMGRGLLYVLWVMVLAFIVRALFNKYLADGDASATTWLWVGWGILGVVPLIMFNLLFFALALIFGGTKKAMRIKKPVAFFPVILGAQVLTVIFFYIGIAANEYLGKHYI